MSANKEPRGFDVSENPWSLSAELPPIEDGVLQPTALQVLDRIDDRFALLTGGGDRLVPVRPVLRPVKAT